MSSVVYSGSMDSYFRHCADENARERELYRLQREDETTCVGFADCPCPKCRRTRVRVTDEHPRHAHRADESYCGACRTATRPTASR